MSSLRRIMSCMRSWAPQGVVFLGYDCAEMVEVVMGTQAVSQYWQRDMIQQIREVLHRGWHVSVRYLPRERNLVADALAKYVCDEVSL